MKKLFYILFIINVFLLLLPLANAQKGHMKLLAVSDTQDGQKGGIADLYLEIKPGDGRVFLETFPLTRVDTQISTRFAKEIACDFADIDCSKYDFFYTITADSPIIAGPSAGAAITILTFSLIKNVDLNDDVAITGTINSGGLIGPVGGLKAKIEAASKAGIKKVLIPFGESIDNMNQSNENETSNDTINLEELRKTYGIEIKEVSVLDDAIYEFTGKKFRERKNNITISQDYKDTMKLLAIELCSRGTRLKNELLKFPESNQSRTARENAMNLSRKGKESFDNGKYYSAASYCFGSNVELNYLVFINDGLDEEEIREKVSSLKKELESFDDEIESKDIKTITDLESYMVAKERLLEAGDFLNIVLESISNKNSSLHNLAYAQERLSSAKSWAQFLKNTGKKFNFDKEVLKNACKEKIAEVEERLQYVQLYFPQNTESTRKEIDYAYTDLQNNNFELCLFKASKAKADVDAVLSVFGVRMNKVDDLVNEKLRIVERNLAEETEKGVFPILGYSYFEYANSLKDTDTISALLYSGYALELSNLDIYFKNSGAISEKTAEITKRIDKKMLSVLAIGMFIGISIASIYQLLGKSRKKVNIKPQQIPKNLLGKKR